MTSDGNTADLESNVIQRTRGKKNWPKAISELLKHHNPDVVTLKSRHKVCALSDEVGDGHEAKNGDYGNYRCIEEQHKGSPPPLFWSASEGREGRVAMGSRNKAVAYERQHEGSHGNLHSKETHYEQEPTLADCTRVSIAVCLQIGQQCIVLHAHDILSWRFWAISQPMYDSMLTKVLERRYVAWQTLCHVAHIITPSDACEGRIYACTIWWSLNAQNLRSLALECF